ncbi:MAG: sensor histidine kinase, partial [Saprospiraceae bacterium]
MQIRQLWRHGLSVVFLFFTFFLPAQKLDSVQLLQLIEQAEVYDSAGIVAVNRLGGYYYMQRNPERLRYYLNKEQQYAKRSQLRAKMIEALYHELLFHQYYSDKDSVMQTARQLISYTEGDTSKLANRNRARAFLQIASKLYYNYNLVDSAYFYYRKALGVAQQANNKSQFAEVSKDLITIYREQKRYQDVLNLVDSTFAELDQMGNEKTVERAVKYIKFEQAIARLKLPDTTASQATLYRNYLDLLNYEIDRGSPVSTVIATSKIISDFSDYLPLDSLIALGERAAQIAEQIDNYQTELNLHHGKNLLRANQLSEAEANLKLFIGLTTNKLQRNYKLTSAYDALTQIYIKSNKAKAAAETFQLYKMYQDSAALDEYQTEIEVIAANYEIEKKQTENRFLQKETEKLKARSFYLTIIGSLLGLGLLIGYYFLRKFRAQNKRLEQLVETKNKVFAILAHDLKGPVAIFNNLTQKLNYLVARNETDRLLKMADYYEESGKKIAQVINNILDWAIAEKDSFVNQPRELTLYPSVLETLSEFNPVIADKQLTVEVDVDKNKQIYFDPNALKIINRNLINNAIKFAPVGSTIKILFDDKTQALDFINAGTSFDQQTIERVKNGIPSESKLGT